MTHRPKYRLILTPLRPCKGADATRLLRAACKRLLRCLGLRVVEINEVEPAAAGDGDYAKPIGGKP